MNKKDLLPLIITPIAILLGSFVIAGGIIWSNIRNAETIRQNAGALQGGAQQGGQLGQPTRVVDSSKLNYADEPYIGKADAPLTIAYWYDYQCPFCSRNEEQSMPSLVKEYINTGKVRFVFKDLQFLGDDSVTLGVVSRAVWALAPTKFYDWHKAIFDVQGQENSGWATREKISSVTSAVLGASVATNVMKLAERNSDTYKKAMEADKAEAAALGIGSTPSFVIGKQSVIGAQPYTAIKAAIDSQLLKK